MMSKRTFFKLGMGGAAGVLLGPLLKPSSVMARSFKLPQTYLESSPHQYWMKLTYNNGRESRETRRRIGVALRNLGAIRGKGLGYAFVSFFDQGLERAYLRFKATRRKPASMFELVQEIYDETIFPQTGPLGGQILFEMLFSLLRGQDGTALGEKASASYRAYRAAALDYKNAYKTSPDPIIREAARKKRAHLLQVWRQSLQELASWYAKREATLNGKFVVQSAMLEGFEASLLAVSPSTPRLDIFPAGNRLMVAWKGGASLQQAPDLRGPWTETRKSSPATFDLNQPHQFFRTIQPGTNSPAVKP